MVDIELLPVSTNPEKPDVWGQKNNANFAALKTAVEEIVNRLDLISPPPDPDPVLATNVTVVPLNTAVKVAWDDVPTATTYKVGRDGVDSTGYPAWSTEVSADTREHIFRKLVNDRTYNFTVEALPGGQPVTVQGTPVADSAVPAPPSSPTLTATVVMSDGRGTLRWEYTGTAIPTGFLVGRDKTDVSGSPAWSTVVGPTVREHIFDRLINGTEYTFSAQMQPGGEPVAVKGTPNAGPVTETTVTGTSGDRTGAVTWTGVTDATGYRVTLFQGTTQVSTVNVAATERSYVFPNLTNGTSYSGRVKPLPDTLNSPEKSYAFTPAATVARKVPFIGRSGLTWNSLVFGHGAQPSTFESWRKRPVDGVLMWPGRQTWAELMWTPTRRPGDFMVWCVPPFPEGIGGSNAKVAAGTYDANIRAFATNLINAGWNTNRTCIRLGWENNGTWYQWSWSNGGVEAWKGAFRRFVQQCRAAGLTNVTWNWCLNKGTQAYNVGYSWTTAYPGDDVVDVVGIDSYDMFTPSFTEAQWNANINGKNPGMNDVAAFCRAHGKLMSLDEWGPVHDVGLPNYGKDNPTYIGYTFNWLKANADILAWENTYDDPGNAGWRHKLSDGSNPQSAARYLQPWPNGWGA